MEIKTSWQSKNNFDTLHTSNRNNNDEVDDDYKNNNVVSRRIKLNKGKE
jgi:hypothetical protein